jgi:hypothetical protein
LALRERGDWLMQLTSTHLHVAARRHSELDGAILYLDNSD